MKNFQYLFISVLAVLSFYLTEKVMIYLENKNPLMQEITEKAVFYEQNYMDALIKDNTIIPGVNGKVINRRKSYIKMGEFGSFNETFLIYDEITPKVSLKAHLDKIIISGNTVKRAVSLLLEPNAKLEEYLDKANINYNIITNLKTDFQIKREYLLGEKSPEAIGDLNALLTRNKINSKICLIDYANLDYCREKQYYLVSPNVTTEANITRVLSQIKSGSIILIKAQLSLENLNLILNELQRQDLKTVYLSTLLSESN